MTWEQGVAIATLFISVASLIWNICNSRKIHKNNLELENVKSYYQLKQSKYALEFKAYEDLSMLLAEMVGNTSVLIYEYMNANHPKFNKQKYAILYDETEQKSMEFINKLKGYAPFIPSEMFDKFYDIRDLCVDGMKLMLPFLEEDKIPNNAQKETIQTKKQEIINDHKRFCDELAELIRVRIVETRM